MLKMRDDEREVKNNKTLYCWAYTGDFFLTFSKNGLKNSNEQVSAILPVVSLAHKHIQHETIV